MKLLPLFLYFSFSISFAQNLHEGVLVDSETKEPLEFINIYNGKDYTISNEEGRYAFTSSKDSITFYRIGYDKLKTTFSQLKDTTFLNKSIFELNEVIVTNGKTLFQKIKDSLKINYRFKPYKEKFLVRLLAKKDDTIWRIQDIQGKLSRNSLYYTENMKRTKTDYVVEVSNMRQLGVKSDDDNTYLIFPSFKKLFESASGIFLNESDYEFTEKKFEDGEKIKLEFKSLPEEKVKITAGYYIINKRTLAIETYYFKSTPVNAPYKKNKWLRFRDTFNEKLIIFKKDLKTDQYYISSAKINDRVEITNEEKSFIKNYDLNKVLVTSDNFGAFEVKSNVNENKDVFKLKYPYNKSYWDSQNQLLLTNEMQEFIQKMGEENTEFKVRSNMD